MIHWPGLANLTGAMPPTSAHSPYPWLASVAFALLWTGFFLRKGPRIRHVMAMCASITLDLSLVLVLEFTKDAVATALALSLNPWQQVHVYSSTLAVVCYIPAIIFGWIRWKNPGASQNLRTWHRRIGYCALFFRTVGFLFMFSMLGRP